MPLRDVTALVRPEFERVDRELATDLAPDRVELQPLLEHVGRYRGKQPRHAVRREL